MASELKHHRALFKLFAFKVGVALELVQSVLFTVLSQERVFFPTLYVSYNDFCVGLDQFIICWEMFFFSIMFIWAYEYGPYRLQVQQGAMTKGVGGALLDVINPWDIVRGVIFMFTAFTSHPHMKSDNLEHRKAMLDAANESPDGRQHSGAEDVELGTNTDMNYSGATQVAEGHK